jgi:hypothetical protein
VAIRLGTGKLRRDKPPPDFVAQLAGAHGTRFTRMSAQPRWNRGSRNPACRDLHGTLERGTRSRVLRALHVGPARRGFCGRGSGGYVQQSSGGEERVSSRMRGTLHVCSGSARALSRLRSTARSADSTCMSTRAVPLSS